jgi:hypothetical protein
MVADHGARGSARDTGAVRRAYRAVAGLLPPVPRFRVQRTLTLARRAARSAAGRVAGSSGALIDLPGTDGRWRRSGVAVLLALGVDEDGLAGVLDGVAAVEGAAGRTLYVTDCDAFHQLRDRGLLFEYIPPRADWEAHIDADGYDAFLARRLQTITRTYRPARVVVHPAGAPLAEGLLAGLLAPGGDGTGAAGG